MGFWGAITRRLGYLTRRSRFEQELNDEIQFHIGTLADELQRSGLSRAEALDRAKREFGSREETRSAWQVRWLEDFFADLRYAACAGQERARRYPPTGKSNAERSRSGHGG